jgi:subtilase family serine protease
VSENYKTFDEDGKVIVHFEIHNIGDAEAGASYATKYMYIDSVLKEKHNAPVPVLGPNGKFNGEFEPEDCPPGADITVTVCADDTHVVDESTEDNNCDTNEFICPTPGKPDLVVSEKWEECVAGQMIVHFIIENIGDADAGESYATLYIDDILVEDQNVWVPEIGPDGKFTSEFVAEDCTPGTTITVTVCADDTHVVDESTEDNNCKLNYFPCPEEDMPDLVVNDTYETLNEDGQVIVHFVVKNKGDAEAGESDASEFEPEPCPSGMTINYTVCADDTKVVDESNEDNNCMTNNCTCPTHGKPDLVVSDMREESVKANGHVIVHFEIHNNGTADAGASFATKYLIIDGVLVEKHNVWVPALGPSGRFNGAFAPEECPLHKNITIIVCADDTHVVDESNETNNCMTNNFTCPSQGPDLVIEKTVEMTNEDCDECRYNVHYKVTNIGNEVADWCCGDVEVGLLVDGMFEGDHRISDLGPGASDEGTFWWNDCPCGEPFDVTVCADYYNVVDESNETNNCETNHEYCGVGAIEVEKKVRYQGRWQDTYWDAEHCDYVEFSRALRLRGVQRYSRKHGLLLRAD